MTDLLPRYGCAAAFDEAYDTIPAPRCIVGAYLPGYRTNGSGGPGGISGGHPLAYFLSDLERHGHAILDIPSYDYDSHHRVALCGIGHNDAVFAETGGTGGSMAAYYENKLPERQIAALRKHA